MDQDVRIDVSAVAGLDLGLCKRVPVGAAQPSLPLESPVLEGMLRAYIAACGANAQTKGLSELIDFVHQPSRRVLVIGSIAAAPTRPSRDFTISVGPSVSGGAGAVVDFSGGLYFWNKPQIGLFGSVSFGSVTNVGVSLVGQITYLFGPAPDVLAGDCLIAGIEVGTPGTAPGPTGGGYLVFSVSPAKLIGLSFAFGVGASMLPANLTVQYSHTWISGK